MHHQAMHQGSVVSALQGEVSELQQQLAEQTRQRTAFETRYAGIESTFKSLDARLRNLCPAAALVLDALVLDGTLDVAYAKVNAPL